VQNHTAVLLPQQRQDTSEQSAREREHRYDVDLMRLICSATIMLGHVGAQFILATRNDPANGAGSYWAGHVAEAIYLVWAWLRNRNDEPMTELAADSLFGSVQPAYHLWFMYTYIPIIVLLAFAVLIRAGQRPWRLGAVLLGIAVLPSVMTTLSEVTGRELPTVAWGFGTYSLVYAVGGALLFSLPRVSARWRRLLLVLLPLTMAGSLWYNTQVHYVMPNAHLFVAVMSICVLLLVSRVRVPEKWRPGLKRLAGAALGAYMVHVLFVEEIVRPLVSPDLSGPVAGLLLAGLVVTVMTLSFATSLLWGRLNLRRLLG